MSIFDGKRLTNETFKLDIERMRRGWYSDKYFENIGRMLTALASEGYVYSGQHHNLPAHVSPDNIAVGDIEVEMQWFTRRMGNTVVVGVDKSLEMLRHCTGYWEGDKFIETADKLQVWAVQDGTVVKSDGNPLNAEAVIKVHGRYRDFALLETPTLGVLTRSSRVATNVYETLMAARGKPVLFFPARFDLHEVQASDGYAYNIAIQRFNMDFSQQIGSFVSTDAQGDWWGGAGGGTVAHAAIASFMGDTAEAMMQFGRILPPNIPRIALVDFNNDSVRDTVRVLEVMFIRNYVMLAIRPKRRNMFCMVFGWIPAETCGMSRLHRWAIPRWIWESTRGSCLTYVKGLILQQRAGTCRQPGEKRRASIVAMSRSLSRAGSARIRSASSRGWEFPWIFTQSARGCSTTMAAQ